MRFTSVSSIFAVNSNQFSQFSLNCFLMSFLWEKESLKSSEFMVNLTTYLLTSFLNILGSVISWSHVKNFRSIPARRVNFFDCLCKQSLFSPALGLALLALLCRPFPGWLLCIFHRTSQSWTITLDSWRTLCCLLVFSAVESDCTLGNAWHWQYCQVLVADGNKAVWCLFRWCWLVAYGIRAGQSPDDHRLHRTWSILCRYHDNVTAAAAVF